MIAPTQGWMWGFRSSVPAEAMPSHGHVHIWYARLQRSNSEMSRFASMLSDEERCRLGSLRFSADRRRFVARRGILRSLLAHYLNCPPYQVPLRCAPGGRLVVESMLAGREGPVRLSVSHSSELAVFGFARDRPIGVDVERLQVLPEADRMAALYFSSEDRAALDRVPDEQRHVSFLHCWTRKEAYLKATGEGLRRCLRSFTVMQLNGEPARLHGWTMIDVRPAAGYVGALVVAGSTPQVSSWAYPNSSTTSEEHLLNWRNRSRA